jgi:hypothetical protein
MNKQNLITLNELANSLNEKGFYKEANIIHEQFIKLSISPDDILMPGESRTINNNSDQDQTQISLENIHQQFLTLSQTIKSLPDEYDGDDYFGDLKTELISSLFKVELKIESLMSQAGMDTSSD